MRIGLGIIGLFVTVVGFSQLVIKPIPLPQNKSLLNGKAAEIRRASLPFWDDFSLSGVTPDSIRVWGTDTSRQWNFEASKDVLISATLAKNPPSYRAVTFDGLKADGSFHGDGRGLTDQLVSDSIDLSGYNEVDDIYFSFYWQAGGNVEVPEKGDSLTLQFYNVLADTTGGTPWRSIWKMDGEDVEFDSIFYQVPIKLDQRYLTNRFVFRFQSYGDQNGPFDAWHVDWIYMNAGRGNDDYYYLDRGFTGQLTSPFAPFKAIPIHQFAANQALYTSPQRAQAFNLDRFLQPTEYIIVLRDLVNNRRIDSIQFGAENPLLPNANPLTHVQERFIEFDGIDLSALSTGDSLVIQSELYIESSDDDFLDGTPIDLRVNDTLRAEYLLHDFYAYDDGTAEYAVGNNIQGGKVGMQFWVEEQDTLTHVDFYFPNIAPASSGSFLTLRIYKDLTNETIIRTQSISISDETLINGFTRYALERPLIVNDTFFITYEQNVNRYVGIGFDRSNPSASRYIFDNIGEEWRRNDRLSGALMIRPVFRAVPEFTLGTEPSMEELMVYPNPTPSHIRIEGSYLSIQLHSISGQLMLQEESVPSHSLQDFPAGLYLLTIKTNSGTTTQKIYKK